VVVEVVSYKGIKVEVRLEQQAKGEWTAEFILVDGDTVTPYPINVPFYSKHQAEHEALAAAYRAINEKH
jgi:hypothetical protein